jgi:hypothetical protein
MGWGDELMAAGEAARLHRTTGRPVMILDGAGEPRWSDVWDGIPYIRRAPTRDTVSLRNAPGERPYIVAKGEERWTWRPYAPTPAEISLTRRERRFAEPFRGLVMVEPDARAKPHANKAWRLERWQAVVDALARRGVRCVQCGPADARSLRGVVCVVTPTFRRACAVLAVARAFAGTEGGLMHAAAATRTPAVILWSEFVAPEVTGYPSMTNIRHAGPPCGSRVPCPTCRASMLAITVDEVVDAIRSRVGDATRAAAGVRATP